MQKNRQNSAEAIGLRSFPGEKCGDSWYERGKRYNQQDTVDQFFHYFRFLLLFLSQAGSDPSLSCLLRHLSHTPWNSNFVFLQGQSLNVLHLLE
ncbi:hypothetical protein V512_012225 [Mesotoga sp. Brook.08.105.5.1]|nr:hypothetical protein V512_012225 [Mesotoga sp. Brook.08.105.5.1]